MLCHTWCPGKTVTGLTLDATRPTPVSKVGCSALLGSETKFTLDGRRSGIAVFQCAVMFCLQCYLHSHAGYYATGVNPARMAQGLGT